MLGINRYITWTLMISVKSVCQSYVKRFKVLFILFFIWLCCCPLGRSPLEKGAGLIKGIIIHLCLVKRVFGLKMASGTMINYCSSSKRSHVVICYWLALLKNKKKNKKKSNTQFSAWNVRRNHSKHFWTPPPPPVCQTGSVTIAQKFLFWQCNQAWVQISSHVYSCQEGGTLTLKPIPVNHAGEPRR